MIACYFGFRTQPHSSPRLVDPTDLPEHPLYLPEGMIRRILVGGFIIAAIVLTLRSGLRDGASDIVEFLLILAGLIAGQYCGKILRRSHSQIWYPVMAHGSAVGVIAASLLLAAQYTLVEQPWPQMSLNVLAAMIGFYFGSRS